MIFAKFENSHIVRAYLFALKIIFVILNKSTQYISFISITLFITFFLIIKQGLFLYEDIFINSLKGLYPEFITSSVSVSNDLKQTFSRDKLSITNEVFVHSEEVEFSYNGEDDITKFMNVRTFNERYKQKLFSTLKDTQNCDKDEKTIWMSSRLYYNLSQDSAFDKRYIYFKDEDDNYLKYNICKFEFENNEKWLLISSSTVKNIAYMPFAKYVVYTDDKKIKEKLYQTHNLDNWKRYIDYDDLGIFLIAKEVSNTFLGTFFIFLFSFMIIAFSSLAKEFEASIFLTKLYGFNIAKTILLYLIFFILYIFFISVFILLEYYIVTYLISMTTDFIVPLDFNLLIMIIEVLLGIGLFVSLFISIKYHRLPL
jgi:hypothetical protein